jgi:hypothetical protein
MPKPAHPFQASLDDVAVPAKMSRRFGALTSNPGDHAAPPDHLTAGRVPRTAGLQHIRDRRYRDPIIDPPPATTLVPFRMRGQQRLHKVPQRLRAVHLSTSLTPAQRMMLDYNNPKRDALLASRYPGGVPNM